MVSGSACGLTSTLLITGMRGVTIVVLASASCGEAGQDVRSGGRILHAQPAASTLALKDITCRLQRMWLGARVLPKTEALHAHLSTEACPPERSPAPPHPAPTPRTCSFSTAGCMKLVWKAPATARRTHILQGRITAYTVAHQVYGRLEALTRDSERCCMLEV